MRRIGITSVLISLLTILEFGCCTPPKIASVGVNLIPQQRDWWCWAATTEMITEFYQHRINQCDSANYVHGTPPNCCTGCTGDCQCWGEDWGASINDIKNNWSHWNFSYKYISSELPWEDPDKDDIKDTISPTQFCRKSPIQVVWWWYPIGWGGGHVVAAYGYAEVGNNRYVSYFNPLPESCEKPNPPGNVCSSVTGGEDAVSTYDAFVDNGVHKWGYSFYDFKYTGK